jgi:putative flippase GtrA
MNCKIKDKNNTIIQGLKYSLVGGICTVLDIFLLYFLTEYFHLNYLLASVFSFLSGSIINYFLCVSWIFDIRKIKKRLHEFMFYILISIVGLLINTLCIWVFSEKFMFHYILSKLIAVVFTFTWNFLSRKYFLHI